MLGVFRCTRGGLRWWEFFSPPRLRAHRAPGIPCALFRESGTFLTNLARKTRGEIAKSYLPFES
jgi:hypothetical protein